MDNNIIKKISRNFAMICILLVVAIFSAQFIILATLGSRGTEVSRVRDEKEYFRLENERLRAEIDRSRTLEKIEPGVQQIYTNANKVTPTEITKKNIEDIESLSFVVDEK